MPELDMGEPLDAREPPCPECDSDRTRVHDDSEKDGILYQCTVCNKVWKCSK